MAEHANVYAALAAAQAQMGKAVKGKENPHFRSKYADLGAVMDACMPALTEHGIAVLQPLHVTETGEYFVKTILCHGESKTETMVPLLLGKRDMQGLGSAITYARRYGLMAMAGIAPEDDDGNGAVRTVKDNPVGAALGDAWKDGVLDKLPDDATPVQRAQAFADQVCQDFAAKTGLKALENEWHRRQKMIDEFETRFPDLHAQVVEAYDRRHAGIQEASEQQETIAAE